MRKKGQEKDAELESILRGVEGASARPVLTVDYELYAHFLDDSDLTEEQKRRRKMPVENSKKMAQSPQFRSKMV